MQKGSIRLLNKETNTPLLISPTVTCLDIFMVI